NSRPVGQNTPTPHRSKTSGNIRRRVAILVLECLAQGTACRHWLYVIVSDYALPCDGSLLWHSCYASMSCLGSVVLQIADVNLKRKVKFGKSCEAKLLVLLDYLPTETPDVHAFLLSPAHLTITFPRTSRTFLPSGFVSLIAAYSLKDLSSTTLSVLPPLPRLHTLNFRAFIVRHPRPADSPHGPSPVPRLELLCVTVTANEARYPGEYPGNTAAHYALTSTALSPKKAFWRSASWWTASVLVLRG
ncbi:hypothetical protein B0H14DRAFT_3562316, partial [Mycena olivaceomarginata]